MIPIRTLHVIDRLDRRLGGSVQATLGVARYLVEAGCPAEVAGSTGPGDEIDDLDRLAPLRVHLFPRSFPARYANSAAFAGWLGRAIENYALVEIHAVFSAFTWRAARIARQQGKPYILRPHGSLDPFDLRKHSLLKNLLGPRLIRPLVGGAAAVVLTSQLEADRLVTYGAQASKIVVPLPVSLSNLTGDRGGFRRRHGIPEDASVVLFLSRLDYKKGLDFLIPALGRLKREFPRLWFVLAGAGSEAFTGRVHSWLGEHGVRAFTTEVGFVGGQEKADALAGADVFALPSLNENFGIVNVEAMHAGLPLLVSDNVYIAGEIVRGGAGVVCPADTAAVAAALRRFLDGSIDRRAMGQRGRDLVQACFRPEASTARLIRIYADIVGRASDPGGAGRGATIPAASRDR